MRRWERQEEGKSKSREGPEKGEEEGAATLLFQDGWIDLQGRSASVQAWWCNWCL